MIRSKKRWFLIVIRILSSVLLLWASFSMLPTNWKEAGLDREMLIAICIGFAGVLNLGFLLMSYGITVSESELVKEYLLGLYKRKITLTEIERYAEVEFENDTLQNKSLFSLGDHVCMEISSIEIANYEDIKSELIKDLDEDKTYTDGWTNRST